MSQTGSTSARRWPINGGPRLRLALVAGVLLATMTAAHADWSVQSVPGTPNDVRVWAPGVFSVATSEGAYLVQADGGMVSVSSPHAVGTRLSSTGCFEGFFSDDVTRSNPITCQSGPVVVETGNVTVVGVKTSESGAAYGLATDFTGPQILVSFTPAENSAWGPSSKLMVEGTPMTLGVLHQGAAEHALTAVGVLNEVMFSWFVDGASKATYGFIDGNPPREVQSIDLFLGGASNPTVLFGWAGNLYRGTLVSGTKPPFVPVSLPTPPGDVTGVDVNTDAGSVYGDGFGMATVVHDGGVTLLSAVPAGQPQDIGLRWQVNPKLPPGVVAPRYLNCKGAQTCVIAQKQPPPGNLLVYINASPPTLSPDAGTSLLEGTMGVPFAIRASDPDGDAVRVTVSDSPSPVLTLAKTEVDGGVDLELSAGLVCENTKVPIVVAASDGLQAHDQVRTLDFEVIHTRRASAPGILPSTNIIVQSGAPELSISTADPVVLPCHLSGFTWTGVTQNAPQLKNDGGSTAVFPTPGFLCQRDGASYVYRVVAHDDAGVESAPRDFSVQVRPWGRPAAPFANEKHVDLVAGDSSQGSAWLTPDTPVHPCASVEGFPDVDTVWELVEGAPLPPGVRLRTQDNTLITAASAVTPKLLVETDPCAAAKLKLSVQHYTRDGSGIEGPPSTVWVNVDPRWTQLKDAQVQFSPDTATPEFIAGTTSAQNLNCIEERGGVKVRITLTRADGSVSQGDFPIGEPWQLPIPAVCGGQRVHLKAELLGNSGPQAEVLPVAELDKDVPAVKVELAPIESPQLVVSCGHAASGILEQRLPPGPCASLALSWEQDGGPELIQSTFTESRIKLTTKETDFGELIGQEVMMRVTANSGVESHKDYSIPIIAEPFVSMDRHVENAVGADTDLIGVSVELHNLTECSVRQVDHLEHLEGADYVPGSARFNDTPVEVEVNGESLIIRGLPLEANGTGRLTYVVRPRLLGKTRIEGQTFVRGIRVSESVQVPISGCGCEGGGSGFATLGLAGLAAVLRRRRAR